MVTDLLEILGYTEGEHLSLNYQRPGGAFRSEVVEYSPEIEERAAAAAGDGHGWFGVNPTRARGTDEKGRGTAEDTTRFAAIWCDLDVKPDACRDIPHALAVVDQLSAILGVRPSAIVYSGGGLQPYWPIDDGRIDNDDTRADRAALLKRWGRLACIVADGLGAKIDRGVYDLARVLRLPGTVNPKYDPPRPVTIEPDTGAPLTVEELRERLDEHGVAEYESDRRTAQEIVSRPDSWKFAAGTCEYFAPTIKAWADEPIAERHPWLVKVTVRLMAALRNGCLSADEFAAAEAMIVARFKAECARTGRDVPPFEIPNAFRWAEIQVAAKADGELATEFGSHLHLWQRAEPRRIELLPTPPTDGALAAVVDINERRQPVSADVTLTDTGNADLLVAAWGDRLRYCPDTGRWLSWVGTRWQAVGEAVPFEAARSVIEAIKSERDDEAARHKRRSLSRRGISDAVALAQRRTAMCVDLAALDSRAYELNTPSGVVEVRGGALLPHSPEAWHTKITGAGYDPAAAAPMWEKFLAATFGGDAALIGYVQRLAGLAVIGEVLHHVLPFLFGGGSNGKSVLMDVFTAVLGDYAITAPLNFLLAGRERHETEIARLHGARLVVCSEVNQGSKFDEAKVKALTGGDMLSGRYMRQDLWDFRPSHTLFLMGNHQPAVTGGGTSFWRRLQTVPFNHTVPEHERVEGLAQKLVDTEGPAILAWMADGARRVLAEGLTAPAAVRDATAAYAVEEDSIGRFVAECLDVDEACSTPAAKVTGAYNRWCLALNEKPKSAVEFGRELARHGVPKDKGRRNYLASIRSGWRPEDLLR